MLKLQKYRKQIIAILDICIIISVAIVLFLIFPSSNGTESKNLTLLARDGFILLVCIFIFQAGFKTYDSLWRYAESKEYLTLFAGVVLGFLSYSAVIAVIGDKSIGWFYTLAVCTTSLLGMFTMRFCYRWYRTYTMPIQTVQGKINVAIVGAGEAGVRLAKEFEKNSESRYNTVCFFDDSSEKIGKQIHEISVKGSISDIPKMINDMGVQEIIIAIPSLSPQQCKPILEVCSGLKCKVKILPSTLALIDNVNLLQKVRDVDIDDLLGREAVSFQNQNVEQFINGKVVLVTGGGGSIGSELCRQIAASKPQKLIVLDIYENNAYEIQQELYRRFGDNLELTVEIASVRDKEKIDELFDFYRPDIVFHAAAHKHVPLMEVCPGEAIKNNIFGTYNVVMAADKYTVSKFVLISTDKAVNPTNILGASKRFCEMLLQSMREVSNTKYVAVRFGNVLGSNGSVVPLFKKQINEGGPVTITDNRIIRYFMTISEAAQLVLQAGAMAEKSEVYVLDMGSQVKILDLAEKLIRLSGYKPYEDIEIIETGLRAGEKLYEELLIADEELLTATSNNKIFIERQHEISPCEVQEQLYLLGKAVKTQNKEAIKTAMKKAVPTFKDPSEVNGKFI